MDLINLSEAEKNIYLQWHFYLVWFFEFLLQYVLQQNMAQIVS